MNEELKAKILEHYQKGEGSMQDIARVYRLTVGEVLDILGIDDLNTVQITGDLIDPDEVGPGATWNPGSTIKTEFTTN